MSDNTEKNKEIEIVIDKEVEKDTPENLTNKDISVQKFVHLPVLQAKPSYEDNYSLHSIKSEKSEKTKISIYKNWTDKNKTTVVNWKNDLTQIGFAYDYVISKYRKKEKTYSIWLFIITTIMTTVSLSQFNNSEENDKTLSIIFKIGFATLSFISTILSGIQKINNYSKMIEDYRSYVDNLENFVTLLNSELMLPDNLRKDALEFILLHRTTFQKLMSNNPDIDDADYKKGVDNYLDFVDNIENRKYNRRKSKFKGENSINIIMEEH